MLHFFKLYDLTKSWILGRSLLKGEHGMSRETSQPLQTLTQLVPMSNLHFWGLKFNTSSCEQIVSSNGQMVAKRRRCFACSTRETETLIVPSGIWRNYIGIPVRLMAFSTFGCWNVKTSAAVTIYRLWAERELTNTVWKNWITGAFVEMHQHTGSNPADSPIPVADSKIVTH